MQVQLKILGGALKFQNLELYIIISTDAIPLNHLIPFAETVIRKGVDAIQFRHKGSFYRDVFLLAKKIKGLCQETGIPLIINDRVDVALLLDADGVHLGQRDLPISTARKIMGPHKIIGGTASTLNEALCIEKLGANYIGLGHVFPTTSKLKDSHPLGLESLQTVCNRVSIPVIAIGGIQTKNISSVFQAGAKGAALISELSSLKDPKNRLKKLQELIEMKENHVNKN